MERIRQSKILIWAVAVITAAVMLTPATALASSSTQITKDETVYVIQDANGNAEKTLVSDYLNNSPQLSNISDATNLSNIENVKGDEKYTKSGSDSLSWAAKGKSIYYRGTSYQQTPITMSIDYYLDGVKMTPKQIKGKSGDLEIKINYTNNAKSGDVYVPFFVASVLVMKDDQFTDVKIDNGKVIDDGDKQMVAGVTMPGLSDSLGVSSSKLDIPESLDITAQVSDFSLDTIVTVAANNLFDNMDLSGVSSLSGLDKQINKLDKSAQTLVKGSVKIAKGTQEAYDGSKKLYAGSSTLSTNMSKLSLGLETAQKGTKALDTGLGDLQTGMGTLSSKLPALTSGIASLDSGMNSTTGLKNSVDAYTGGVDTARSEILKVYDTTLTDYKTAAYTYQQSGDTAAKAKMETLSKVLFGDGGSSNDVKEGSLAYSAGVINKTVSGKQDDFTSTDTANSSALRKGVSDAAAGAAQLNASVPTLTQGLSSLATGVNNAKSGADQLLTGIDSAYGGSVQLTAGTKNLQSGAKNLVSGEKTLASGTSELAQGMSQFYDQGIAKIVKLYNGDIKTVVKRLQDLSTASQNYTTFTKLANNTKGDVKFLYRTDAIGE